LQQEALLGLGVWGGRSGPHSPRGGGSGQQNEYLKLRKNFILNESNDFLRSTELKLLRKLEVNSISSCDYFKDYNFSLWRPV
jgi:hypothetical protein